MGSHISPIPNREEDLPGRMRIRNTAGRSPKKLTIEVRGLRSSTDMWEILLSGWRRSGFVIEMAARTSIPRSGTGVMELQVLPGEVGLNSCLIPGSYSYN